VSVPAGPMEEVARLVAHLQGAIDRFQEALASLHPSSAATLPAMSVTLNRIVESTEHAALRVLDEADALEADAAALGAALEAVRPWLPDRLEAQAAWHQAMARCELWRTRALRLATAMEFQDLTAQQLAGVLSAVEDVRGRLQAVLDLFGALPEAAPLAADGQPPEPLPVQPDRGRQAAADTLVAEHRRSSSETSPS
jgi:chemotaxis regulatin CheY-phosphate phosphatase CheZ